MLKYAVSFESVTAYKPDNQPAKKELDFYLKDSYLN